MKKVTVLTVVLFLLAFSGCGYESKQPVVATGSPTATGTPSKTDVVAGTAPEKVQPPWSRKKDMPTARYSHRSAVLDDKIYVLGGSNGSNLDVVEVYDTKTDTWTGAADIPMTTECIGAVGTGGRIYAFMKGKTYDEKGWVFEYDPALDKWEQKCRMTSARSNLGITVLDEKIYVIGGLENTDAEGHFENVKDVETLDPKTMVWEKKADLTEAKHAVSVSALNGKIYAVGGSITSGTSDYPCKDVEEYDPATDSWTKKANLPNQNAYNCSAILNGQIYVTGGVTGRRLFSYDPVQDKWTAGEFRDIASWHNTASAAGGKLYVIGGTDTMGDGSWTALNAVEVYDPQLDTE